MYDSPKHAVVITPNDTNDLGAATEWISFANTGAQTLTIDTVAGEVKVLILLPAGMWRIRAKKVWSTGTTVTSIVGYWN